MKVVVLGGGIIGITTCYFLARRGIDVTLIERHDKAAMETSYGNAGLYNPSDAFAWASPGALKLALKSLFRRDSGIQYKLRFDPQLWRWSMQFLSQCTDTAARRNTLIKLRLASYSLAQLDEVVAHTGVSFDQHKNGILYASRSPDVFANMCNSMSLLSDNGIELQILDSEAIAEKIPALGKRSTQFAGAVYSPNCQTGDSHKFANKLSKWCEENSDCEFHWNTEIEHITSDGKRVTAIKTNRGKFTGDTYILAAGTASPLLAREVGLHLPIYPIKGFSISAVIRNINAAPDMGFVDEDHYLAISRLGNSLRVASSAIFDGFDRQYKERDFNNIFNTVRSLFPDAADYLKAERWAGLRPMTPSSVPVVGRSKIDNLFLNVGHGHLGWTMSCGCGGLIADCVADEKTAISMDGLHP